MENKRFINKRMSEQAVTVPLSVREHVYKDWLDAFVQDDDEWLKNTEDAA